MDDGLGGALTYQDTSLPGNDPSTYSHTIDMSAISPVGVVGRIYKFKLQAVNNAGYATSSALSVALASLPSKPSKAPFYDATGTNQY